MGPAGVDANDLAARHRVPSICGMEATTSSIYMVPIMLCISGQICLDPMLREEKQRDRAL